MASSQWGDEGLKHVGKRRVRISGRFFPQGAGAVVNTSNIGKKGWTVARISAGLFRITLDQHWLKYVLIGSGLQMNALTNLALQWGPIVTTGAQPTIDITAHAAGVATDIAANANNSISFEIECMQDTVQG